MGQDGAPRLGPTRADVLQHLRTVAGAVPVSQVSGAVGLHPNSTRFHLDALTRAGLVVREVERRSRPGRPRVLYRAVPDEQAHAYQHLASVMVRHFAGSVHGRAQRALSAGEEWGAELRTAGLGDPLERVVGAMQALGYQPRLATGADTRLELGRCPYLELADEDPQVVCNLHLGLVRGLLGPDAPWTVTGIHPWATPTTCLVHLAPTAGAGADA